MSKRQVLYLGLAVVVGALGVWDFVRGDFMWGALFAGCAVLDVVNAFVKRAE